ncbi:MAG: helix-turn-helix domain-containing protein [Schleiferilactobacillus harbinensis]|jgi:transcriptional regulator with XRE-family HTH domain|uniref:Transcription regulator n=1 Tax=Schleiferilactobacillus perolens DSM 12744 TaxID=1423792 RepID=A0A0R1MZL5_9LACO|nr:helix-turn-helix transcriptional regulator [Schleiferilactobacillus perolens]KRL13527.1 transcription regulator [Schleiferilactobacillus perolens DSM 12744]MCI1891292.1 helix-turn-helix domain-containing protein [Schleiferilactobacillus harbinensis]MCI1912730.1 helix-turn-helix domain-containing protein [Schleiferilactobacillus harbinensis]
MQSIGSTVKYLRQLKGFTQKEIYDGIVSRSFGIRFEQGKHDIGADKLFSLLDRLGVNADEFRYIQQGNTHTPAQQQLAAIDHYYHQEDFLSLRRYMTVAKDAPLPVQTNAAYARLLVAAWDGRFSTLSADTRRFLNHYLHQPQWTVQDIRFASVLIIPILQAPHHTQKLKMLTTRMETSCARYIQDLSDPYDIRGELLNFYFVIFQAEATQRHMAIARTYGEKAAALPDTSLTWSDRILKKTIQGLTAWYFDDWAKGTRIINTLTQLLTLFEPNAERVLPTIFRVRRVDAQKYRKEKDPR